MSRTLLVAINVMLFMAVAGSTAIAFPIAVPGTECKLVIVTSASPVVATYRGNSATYSNDLFLERDASGLPGMDGNSANDLFIFNNHTSPVGATMVLGSFPTGTELSFRLFVRNTGYNYFNGPASRNPDNVCHARVQGSWQLNESLVSFEDLFGTPEGANGFNDLSFSFTNTDPNIPPIPQGFPAGNVVNVCNVGERSISLSTGFTSPEPVQITTTVITTDLPPGRFNLTNAPGNPSLQVLEFFPARSDLGHPYSVTYVATDNGVPPQSTTMNVQINVNQANCPTPVKVSTWGALKRIYR